MISVMITSASLMKTFKRARSKAALQRFGRVFAESRWTCFLMTQISTKLKAFNKVDRGVQTVKIKDIVGSVGRNEDFDRNFLP